MKNYLFLLILILLSFDIFSQFSKEEKTLFKMRNDFTHILVSDIDLDGDDDILGSAYNKLYLLKNNNSGIFQIDSVILETKELIYSFNIEDINSDSLMDIVTLHSDPNNGFLGKILIWGQSPSFIFSLKNTLKGEMNGRIKNKNFIFKDFDNDGLKDIFTTGLSNTNIFKHTSDYNFILHKTINFVDGILSEDLNNDGWLDLIGSGGNFIQVALNKGNGDYNPIIKYGAPNAVYSSNSDFELLDVNNDSFLDLVMLLNSESKLIQFNNIGNGEFIKKNELCISTEIKGNLLKNDLNNDGKIDLIFRSGNNYGLGVLYGILGNGVSFDDRFKIKDIDFLSPTVLFSNKVGNNKNNLITYELDEYHRFGSINVYTESTQGFFQNLTKYRQKFYINYLDLIIRDFDKNKILDFAKPPIFYFGDTIGNYTTKVDSNFVAENHYTFQIITSTDLNKDGILDIIGRNDRNINGAKVIGVWYGLVGGNFTSFNKISNELFGDINNVTVSDLNNDGWDDVSYSNFTGIGNSQIFYIINKGSNNGFYSENSIWNNWEKNYSIDNFQIDILKFDTLKSASNIDFAFISNNKIQIKLKPAEKPIELNIDALDIDFLDIDVDNKTDLLYNNGNAGFGWIKNEVNDFVDKGIFFPGNFLSKPDYNDIDNDGDIDILVYRDTTLYLIKNIGFGDFEVPTKVNITSNGDYFVRSKYYYSNDINNDGFDEIMYVKCSTNYQNQSYGDLVLLENLNKNQTKVNGCVFYDLNNNKKRDVNEKGIKNIQINLDGKNIFYSDQDGLFTTSVNVENKFIECNPIKNWKLTTDSVRYNSVYNLKDTLFFGFFYDTIRTELNLDIVGGLPRCNSQMNIWVQIQNIGNVSESGYFSLKLDDSLKFLSSGFPLDSIKGNTIFWHYDSINSFNNSIYNLSVLNPSYKSMGDTLGSTLSNYVKDVNNNYNFLSSDTLKQILVCGFDPNLKEVNPKGQSDKGYVKSDQNFEYIIHFQNTGNDTVFNVRISDLLDKDLNINTFKFLSSSHNVETKIDDNNKLVFNFKNINLPDTSKNLIKSQGFVKYSISCNPNLLLNTDINNTADIFFDYNPPIKTNTVLNTIVSCENLLQVDDNKICLGDTFKLYSNNFFNTKNSWYLNGGIISHDSLLFFKSINSIDTIRFIAENNYCFIDTVFILETISDFSANLFLPKDTNLCVGNEILLKSNSPINNQWYYNSLKRGNDSIFLADKTGEYILKRYNQDCFSSDTINIVYHDVPIPYIFGPDTMYFCKNKSQVLTSSLANNNFWYENGKLISQNYSITVSNEGKYKLENKNTYCSSINSDSVLVLESPTPISIIISQNDTLKSIDITNGNFYYWIECTNEGIVKYGNEPYFKPLNNQSYKLLISNLYGCYETSECFDYLNVFDNKKEDIFIISNPIDSKLIVDFNYEFDTSDLKIEVIDELNRVIISKKGVNTIDVSGLVNGTYFVRIYFKNEIINKKVLVLHP